MASLNTFQTESQLEAAGKPYTIYSLKKLAERGHEKIQRLPKSLKVLLENLLRYEDNNTVHKQDIEALISWVDTGKASKEIAYRPARVLMQDFTGVPAVVDLAAMRDAMKNLGGDTKKINPLAQVDLVIDHSVSVDSFGSPESFNRNVEVEFQRNKERYVFLKWGQNSFENFRVVPPGTGICHQVNLEYLAKTVWTKNENGKTYAFPDTLVGTDSHTTMINGVSVLGWGVGGIEAEAAMLGQPISMLIPEVVGFELTGELTEGITATDLVLTVVNMLRKHGVVGKFVEFYGSGLDHLTLADRATIANMAPEYGATCGFFPIDQETLNYLKLTGRSEETLALVETYAKEQGLWRNPGEETVYSSTLQLDMNTVEASLAGPKRPQDRISLKNVHVEFQKFQSENPSKKDKVEIPEIETELKTGDVVIAAITSCTNTSNPTVMIGAGLVARKARKLGLKVKPWVKTSFAPGSQVVTDYMVKSELQKDLDALGFNLVGYGCTTCIGNSGPLPEPISKGIDEGELLVCSVLSGNRNFEGRVNPQTKGNYLASPPLVVAYALAGNMNINITKDAIGQDTNGNDVFLKDIWPTNKEIQQTIAQSVSRQMFQERYSNVFEGPKEWQDIATSKGDTYGWDESTYIQNPPYFEGMSTEITSPQDILNARPLAILGDSVTTDHISPAGRIENDGPAEKYLKDQGVERKDFNSYGSRRGNHQVMMRGTFANIRLRNELAPGTEGGWTKYLPTGDVMSIFDAAQRYKADNTPLVVIGGKEYGTGSSRDWAAKGTLLLGVRAVITESFERIHRSNLIGMGVLPLQFPKGITRKTLNLDGSESYNITGVGHLKPQSTVNCEIIRTDGSKENIELTCRLDTANEVEYFRHGGILQYVLRELL